MKFYDASCVALLIFFSISMIISLGKFYYEESQKEENFIEKQDSKNSNSEQQSSHKYSRRKATR